MKLTLEQLVEKYEAGTLTDADLKESGYDREEVMAQTKSGKQKDDSGHRRKEEGNDPKSKVMGALGLAADAYNSFYKDLQKK